MTCSAKKQFTYSLHFSHRVVSNPLRAYELHHARPLCPSPTPRVHPNICSSRLWCHPAISLSVIPSPPDPNLSIIRDFYKTALRMRWPKYWSFSFSIIPSKEQPGLISLRMDWWDLLAVQEMLKSLLQHRSSKESILWCSAFFTVQLTSIPDHWKN